MIYSIVGGDGSARIELDGRKTKIRGRSVDDARIRVLSKAREYAEETNTVQPMTAVDPSGEWLMYVHPNGDIVPAQDPAAPAPQPVANAAEPEPTPPPYVPPRIQAAPIDLVPTPLAARFVPDPTPSVWPDAVQLAPVDPAPAPSVWPEPRPVLETEEIHAPAPNTAEGLEHEATVLVVRRLRAIVTITIDGGSAETRTAPVLIGRKPVARIGHSTLGLDSVGREVSRTHALVDVDDQGRILITDLRSANGVYVNGHELAPDQPTIVPDQARIELGDVTINIGRNDR